MEECIFENKPDDCDYCYESIKLQCLLNRWRYKVRVGAKPELLEILMKAYNSPRRVK